jgi:hypothetical protein
MPSSPNTFATAPISESIFFGSAKAAASFQSGRIALEYFCCASLVQHHRLRHTLLFQQFDGFGKLAQAHPKCSFCANFANSASASSLMAITAISIPGCVRLATPETESRVPAISPQPLSPVVAGSDFGHLERAADLLRKSRVRRIR